jgi:hypothetical protein
MNLVFVHLGSSNPEHLWANIRYCLKTFPIARITVVLDHRGHQKHINDLGIKVHFYERTSLEESVMSDLSHDFGFRMGFWRYSIERILALNNWHSLHKDESFIHVESDVLLLNNFPWSQFGEYNKLAWLRHSYSLDCAAILFSPSFRETSWLRDEVVTLLKSDSGLTDMTALNQISKMHPNRVALLPTVENSWVKDFGKQSQESARLLSKEFNSFNGVFDPAAIGVWLTGNDPRNRLGWITRYSSHFDPLVDPNTLRYSGKFGQGVSVSLDSIPVPLFNLHIHSKQISYFRSFGAFRIYFDILTSRNRRFKNRIVFVQTFLVVKSYLSRGNKIFSIRTISNIRGFMHSRKA